MEWSAEDIYKVINLYRQFPCLWDLSSSHYKRQDVKRNAWQKIAKNMEKDEEEVKKKVKNLRCAYVAAKRKVDSVKRSGSTGKVYHPHLFYYRELQFLDSEIMFRRTINNLESQKNEKPTITYESDNCIMEGISNSEDNDFDQKNENSTVTFESDNFIVDEISISEDNKFDVPKCQESLMSSSSVDTPIVTKTCSKSYKRKWTEREEKFNTAIDAFVKQANMSCSLMASSNKQKGETMHSAFGKTVALQLAQLSLGSAVKTMSEIQQILTTKILSVAEIDFLQTADDESGTF